MIRPHAAKAPGGRSLIADLLAVASVSTAACGIALFPACANAAPTTRAHARTTLVTDHSHDGNGRHNRVISAVRSPTHNRGNQHTSNSNAGGMTSVMNGLCRKSRVCNVTQKVTIIMPGITDKRPPESTGSIEAPRPRNEMELSPASGDGVDAEKAEGLAQNKPDGLAQAKIGPRVPNASPFLYLGPYGFMLMAPPSGIRTSVASPYGMDDPSPFETTMFP